MDTALTQEPHGHMYAPNTWYVASTTEELDL